MERRITTGNKVMLKPSRKVVRQNLPRNNLRPPYMMLSKIGRSWYVIAERHFDKDGNHNGYLLPFTGQDGRFEQMFVWTEYLTTVHGLKVAQ